MAGERRHKLLVNVRVGVYRHGFLVSSAQFISTSAAVVFSLAVTGVKCGERHSTVVKRANPANPGSVRNTLWALILQRMTVDAVRWLKPIDEPALTALVVHINTSKCDGRDAASFGYGSFRFAACDRLRECSTSHLRKCGHLALT